jgi:hypothetical protein
MVLRVPKNALRAGISITSLVRNTLLASAVFITALSASSAAFAQCVNTNFNIAGGILGPFGFRNLIPTPSPIISIMNTVNTAFLTNSTSFVSAPPGPQPDQGSGGVWSRAIAGFADATANSVTVVRPGFNLGFPFGDARGTQNCRQTTQQNYTGSQIGTDIGKLNIGNSGANWHFGVTASYFDAWTRDTTPVSTLYSAGDLKSHFEVPSVGLYTAFTQGNFFADTQVRWDFYQSTSSSVLQDFHGAQEDALGISVSGSAGYKIPIMSNWFIEPSLGGSWSQVKVDPVTLVDRFGIGGTVHVDDITSILGRASLRVGTNITQGIYTWQPFVTASAVHEFAGKVTSTSTIVEPSPGNFNGMVFDTSTERLGTFGQFGLGTAIVFGDTGWLGYGRGDLKVGENLNVGLRYQW